MVVTAVEGLTLIDLAVSFERALLAQNKSPRPVKSYMEVVMQFARFLEASEVPGQVGLVGREHFESDLADVLSKWKPATLANRYRSLQQFF